MNIRSYFLTGRRHYPFKKSLSLNSCLYLNLFVCTVSYRNCIGFFFTDCIGSILSCSLYCFPAPQIITGVVLGKNLIHRCLPCVLISSSCLAHPQADLLFPAGTENAGKRSYLRNNHLIRMKTDAPVVVFRVKLMIKEICKRGKLCTIQQK